MILKLQGPIGKGYKILIDDCLSFLNKRPWSLDPSRVYTHTHEGTGNTQALTLHTLLMHPRAGYSVEHINGDLFDYRLSNLRTLPRAEYMSKAQKVPKDQRGVFYSVATGKWIARTQPLSIPYYVWLGRYPTQEAAHKAVTKAKAQGLPKRNNQKGSPRKGRKGLADLPTRQQLIYMVEDVLS